MKKKLLSLLTCFILFLGFGFAQLDSMEVNTLKVKLFSDGGLEEISVQDSGVYKNLIYTQALWIAGIDANSTLRLSQQTYRTFLPDFQAGPISNDPNAATIYNQVYHIKLETISDFVNGNTSGIPAEIANWPAHGNTAFGEAANLAPFVDVDQNGTYDPTLGDYPDIKGDEALFAIFNDANHRQGTGLGLEFHLMLYGYHTGGIQDSILYGDYTVFNRSGENFASMYMSLFTDFDLGHATDDLPGTNVSGDAVFCYNANDNDSGPAGFGNQPASCGVRILKGPPADFLDGIDNDKDGCVDGVLINGICQPENPASGIREHYKLSGSMAYVRTGSGGLTNTSDPGTPGQFYSYMQNLWKNGNNLVVENPSGFGNPANGDGYTADGSGIKTNYFFPGSSFDTTGAFSPASPNNWFASPNHNADFRTLANMGPFSLAAGESFDLQIAISWSRDSSARDGYTHINRQLANLNNINKPIRNISIRNFSAQNAYKVYFDVKSQDWMIRNLSDQSLSFKMLSMTGKLMALIELPAHSDTRINDTALPAGVYLLINQGSGIAHKITR